MVLIALGVCARHHSEMEAGSSVSQGWHPLLEANPFLPATSDRAAKEAAAELPRLQRVMSSTEASRSASAKQGTNQEDQQ